MSESRPSPWRAGVELVAPHRRQFAGLGLVLTLSSAVALVAPLLIRAFIDRALAGDPQSSLIEIAGAYVALSIASPAVELVVFASSTSLIWRIVNDFRVRLARHVLRLPREFHTSRSPGALVERIDGDLTALADFAATFVLTLIRVALTAAGAVVVVGFFDVRVAVALVVYVVVAVGGLFAIRSRAVDASEVERGALGHLYGHLEELLAGVDDLRSNDGGPWALDVHRVDAHHAFHAAQHRERAIIWVWHGATGIVTGGTFVGLVMAAYGTRSGWITLGTAFLLFQYTQVLANPIFALVEQLQEIQKAAGGFRRALELLTREPTASSRGAAVLPPGAPSIAFDHVGFAYEDDMVLHDCSFVLGAGQSLGVVGRTGSGKSTLSRLVTGDLGADSGSVRLGGVDMADIDPDGIGHRIGVVTQEVYLFGGTLRDNVTIFDRSIPDAEVHAALVRVGLADRLLDVDHGLDTPIDGTGSDLSAGEAQLLGLARVLVRNPSVVILDEATARVDPATEHQLSAAMAELLAGRTAVVIAHRLRTLDVVDHILVLDHGRVVEFGPRAELLARESTFARLSALTAADDDDVDESTSTGGSR
jgi:ATP-binding cassette subfamily B protein